MKMQRISATEIMCAGMAAAIFAAIAALFVCKLLFPALGGQNPYHTAWAAVVFSAWYCGVGPSICCDLSWTSSASGTGFCRRTARFSSPTQERKFPGCWASLSSLVSSWRSEKRNRRSLAKSRLAEEQLRSAQAELERKVQERTAELSLANENLRELSGQLQQLRDDERKQIARELHDSVGQLLAALSMNIATVQAQSHKFDPAAARAVSENSALVQQIGKEIRTLSHLLHPPLLDVAGLASALRWYVDGFSERSNIKVDFEIPAEFRRLLRSDGNRDFPSRPGMPHQYSSSLRKRSSENSDS